MDMQETPTMKTNENTAFAAVLVAEHIADFGLPIAD